MSDAENLPATQRGTSVAVNTSQQGNPFGTTRALSTSVNAGSVAIETERAIAEVQGQIIVAQRCPRDLNKAHAELMAACKSKGFASVAFYTVPNRGSGPSIRFAEEVARVFGNFQFGHRELSRSEDRSEVEVFAWDVEKNNRSIRQITVMHVTDTRNGPKVLRDQADIDNKIANVASKQARGRILALMPKWLVEDAVQECRKTLAGANNEPIEVRVRRMAEVFKAKYGVTIEALEQYTGKKTAELNVDDLVDLQGVFNALKEGASVSEYFGADAAAARAKTDDASGAVLDAGKKLAAQNAAKPAATTAAETPAAAPPADEKQDPAASPPPAAEKPAASPPARRTRAAAAAPVDEKQADPPADPPAAPPPAEETDEPAGMPPVDNGDPGPQTGDFF